MTDVFVYTCGKEALVGPVVIAVYSFPHPPTLDFELAWWLKNHQEFNWDEAPVILDKINKVNPYLLLHVVNPIELNTSHPDLVIASAIELLLPKLIVNFSIESPRIYSFQKGVGSINFKTQYVSKGRNNYNCFVGEVIAESKRRQILCRYRQLKGNTEIGKRWGYADPIVIESLLKKGPNIHFHKLDQVLKMPQIWHRSVQLAYFGKKEIDVIHLTRWDLKVMSWWSRYFFCRFEDSLGEKRYKKTLIYIYRINKRVGVRKQGREAVYSLSEVRGLYRYSHQTNTTDNSPKSPIEQLLLKLALAIKSESKKEKVKRIVKGREMYYPSRLSTLVNEQPLELTLIEALIRTDKLSCLAASQLIKIEQSAELEPFFIQSGALLHQLKEVNPKAYSNLENYSSSSDRDRSVLEEVVLCMLAIILRADAPEPFLKEVIGKHLSQDRKDMRALLAGDINE